MASSTASAASGAPSTSTPHTRPASRTRPVTSPVCTRAPPAIAACIMPRVNFSGWTWAVVRGVPSCCSTASGVTQSGSAAAVHDHTPPAADQSEPVDGDPVEHAATAQGTSGCCSMMKHDGGMMKHDMNASREGCHMNHGATAGVNHGGTAAGCCSGMAADHTGHKEPGAPPDASSFAMPGNGGCDPTKATDRGETDPAADDVTE